MIVKIYFLLIILKPIESACVRRLPSEMYTFIRWISLIIHFFL